MKALVQPDGRVAQVVADDGVFPVHEGLKWIDCDVLTKEDGFTYNFQGKKFDEIVTPELTYREARLSAYPFLRDQLDDIWKQLNQDRLDGKALTKETDDRLNEILQVKADFPKPE
jgi:hypothetical protein